MPLIGSDKEPDAYQRAAKGEFVVQMLIHPSHLLKSIFEFVEQLLDSAEYLGQFLKLFILRIHFSQVKNNLIVEEIAYDLL